MSSRYAKTPKMIYGDYERREAMALPPTFGELQRRCFHAMGCYCEMYLDSAAHGRHPASSPSMPISNEAQYKVVQDGDVIILVDPAGRRLSLRELGSVFDGLTVYKRDYVPHPIRVPRGCRDEEPVDAVPIPDMSRFTYKTSYNAHYTRPKLSPRAPDPPPPEWKPDRTAPPTGLTTYEVDYVPYPYEAKPGPDDNVQEIPRPWTQTYKSTYHKHFESPRLPPPTNAGFSCPFPDKPEGAKWRKTEYTDEYVEKRPYDLRPEPGIDAGPDHLDHGMWDTAHRTSYAPPAKPKQPICFIEPELEA